MYRYLFSSYFPKVNGMFISYGVSASNGFLKWSRSLARNNSNDNDQPGGSTPVCLADSLTGEADSLMGLEGIASG
jgi:hypothetical protein